MVPSSCSAHECSSLVVMAMALLVGFCGLADMVLSLDGSGDLSGGEGSLLFWKSGAASLGFWGLSDVVLSESLLQLAASSARGISRLRTR